MYRIKHNCEHLLEIEKSKFITYLFIIDSEDDAKSYIKDIRKLHPNANHHCYAYICGNNDEITRSNDDKEPSGTAGVPILECLKLNKMSNILSIVVRYFGGIKLGAGGLIRAYSKSTSLALKSIPHMLLVEKYKYNISFSYDLIKKIEYIFASNNISVINKEYNDDNVSYTYLSLIDQFTSSLNELSSGKCTPTFIETVLIEQEVIND